MGKESTLSPALPDLGRNVVAHIELNRGLLYRGGYSRRTVTFLNVRERRTHLPNAQMKGDVIRLFLSPVMATQRQQLVLRATPCAGRGMCNTRGLILRDFDDHLTKGTSGQVFVSLACLIEGIHVVNDGANLVRIQEFVHAVK